MGVECHDDGSFVKGCIVYEAWFGRSVDYCQERVFSTGGIIERDATTFGSSLMYLKVTLQEVSKWFGATECTCWEGPATLIGGASWVSVGDDVANLQDVSEDLNFGCRLNWFKTGSVCVIIPQFVFHLIVEVTLCESVMVKCNAVTMQL